MRRSVGFAALALLIAAQAGGPVLASVEQQPAGELELGPVAIDESVDYEGDRTSTDNFELEAFATAWGVSHDEAQRILQLSDRAGQLLPLLEAGRTDIFAGMWIDPGPDFRVVVQLTAGGHEAISDEIVAVGLEGMVDVQLEKYTYAELRGFHDELRKKYPGTYDSTIDNPNNVVKVMTLDGLRVTQDLETLDLAIPIDALVIEEVETLIEPAVMYGGLHLGAPTCTTGFSVANAAGTLTGITTAGHCGNNATYGGVALPLQAEDTNGDDDVQWHTTPGQTDDNWISTDADASAEREIKGVIHRNNQPEGYPACKYGRTEGLYCGTVTDRDIAPGYLSVPIPVFMRLNPTQVGVDGCSGGDSGGPEYRVTTAPQAVAVGMTSGCIGAGGDHDIIYMAANYISGLGIGVLTG